MQFTKLIVMIVEIMIAEYLFGANFAKRKLFWLRFLGYGVAAIVITFWVSTIYMIVTGKNFEYGAPVEGVVDSLFNFVFYCGIFAMTCVVCFLSYKETPAQIFFCCSGAYAIQHIARNLSGLTELLPVFDNENYGMILSVVVTVLVYFSVYIGSYFFLIKPRKESNVYIADSPRKIILSLSVLVICIFMSRLTNDNPERDILSVVSESIYAILCSILVLYVQFAVTDNENMKYEVDSMNELLRSERKQFELSKRNIDLINIKCHDMKHQISALRKNASEENIAEIENAIMIYDSNVKTGNDALDIILTEKKLYCEDKKIQLICCVDGKRISFMNNVDIYSLFGNALSNAIESVSKLSDEQKRCVKINVINVEKVLSIHVENYFEGTLSFENGLPRTDKGGDFHGFGMKSMERIASKYGGEISVVASDNKFNLDIIIPIPD